MHMSELETNFKKVSVKPGKLLEVDFVEELGVGHEPFVVRVVEVSRWHRGPREVLLEEEAFGRRHILPLSGVVSGRSGIFSFKNIEGSKG